MPYLTLIETENPVTVPDAKQHVQCKLEACNSGNCIYQSNGMCLAPLFTGHDTTFDPYDGCMDFKLHLE